MRILAYSHDSYGLGHLRRSLNVMGELRRARADSEILIVTGCARPDLFELPLGADLLVLPGLTKDRSGRYLGRRLRLATDELVQIRAAIIEAAASSFRPDCVLVDHTPTGLGGELVPTLDALAERGGTRLLLGMRDVLDDPSRARRQLAQPLVRDVLERYYDEILVYGLPHVCDLGLEYALPRSIARKLRYVGIACHEAKSYSVGAPSTMSRLLITAGGGEDGGPLLDAGMRFLSSSASNGWTATMVTGPYLNAGSRARLVEHAATLDHVEVLESVTNLADLAARCDAVVSMGGYNTLYENVFARRPLVVYPRTTPRLEQWERARRLEGLGLLVTLQAEDLKDPRRFGRAVDRARSERVDPLDVGLRFDGARLAAHALAQTAPSALSDGKSTWTMGSDA